MSPSATSATQNEGRCRQEPRLPRKVPRRPRRPPGPNAPPEPAQCHKCHACTQNEGRCRQAPRLPRKVKVDVAKRHACHTKCRGDNGVHRDPSTSPEPAQCHKCHACHAKRRSMYLWKRCLGKTSWTMISRRDLLARFLSMQGKILQKPFFSESYRNNAASQTPGRHCARACAVELHFSSSQGPLQTKNCRKNAAAHTLCKPAQSNCTSTCHNGQSIFMHWSRW